MDRPISETNLNKEETWLEVRPLGVATLAIS
jgi:hypothetical protein